MTAQVASAQQLVFLVGSPHSGAQWIQLLLAQHPGLATAAATDLFSHYLQPLLVADAPSRKSVAGVGFPALLQPEEYRRFVTGAAAVALRRIAASKPKARILLEASPGHGRVWRDILRYYPKAKFIHVLRDPREVVADSIQARAAGGADPDAAGIIESALLWRDDVDALRELVEDGRRCQEVRYEHLQTRPLAVLQQLLSWLGLEASTEQCRTYVSRLGQHSAAAKGLPWGKAAATVVGLSRREIACVELVARETMIRYEYEFESEQIGRRAKLKLAAHRFLQMMEDSAHAMRHRL